jgi:hypothetical protein
MQNIVEWDMNIRRGRGTAASTAAGSAMLSACLLLDSVCDSRVGGVLSKCWVQQKQLNSSCGL